MVVSCVDAVYKMLLRGPLRPYASVTAKRSQGYGERNRQDMRQTLERVRREWKKKTSLTFVQLMEAGTAGKNLRQSRNGYAHPRAPGPEEIEAHLKTLRDHGVEHDQDVCCLRAVHGVVTAPAPDS